MGGSSQAALLPRMNLSIFGLGYVGTVLAGCFAKGGHHVTGVDPEVTKVELINAGKSPIVEAEVEELLRDAMAHGRLRGTRNAAAAVAESEVSLICVGTPSQPSGELDLTYVRRVCAEIGAALREKASRHIVVVRSTVLPGTIDGVIIPAMENASGKIAGEDFGIVMNPEFMRESSAVRDFYAPPKTVIGTSSPEDSAIVASLYAGLPGPMIHTTTRIAEMVKYADNIWHAAKVTFANEIGLAAKSLGVDGQEVMRIFCEDTKLNLSPAYLKPGFAFGGSCLPKDLRALMWAARSRQLDLPMLNSLSASNEAQIRHAIQLVLAEGRKRIAVLGFAFKGGTDDLRESPMVTVIEALLGKGCEIRLFDPHVNTARLVGANRRFIEQHIPHLAKLMVESVAAALEDAELIIIGNINNDYFAALEQLRPEQRVLDFTSAGRVLKTAARHERISG
jgi:GDP-mannose 6-dehydrogenase